MADERELSVRKWWLAPEQLDRPEMGEWNEADDLNGVWLECDGKRCGDLEPWMVEWLKDGSYPSGVPKNHMETLKQYDRRLDLTVGHAIERILKEAQSG